MDGKITDWKFTKSSINFKVKSNDLSDVNFIREIILLDIPVMVPTNIRIYKNSSVRTDEYINHRIRMIPIFCKDYTELKTSFTIDVENDGKDPINVMSDDILSDDILSDDIIPKDILSDDIPKDGSDGKVSNFVFHKGIIITTLSPGKSFACKIQAEMNTVRKTGNIACKHYSCVSLSKDDDNISFKISRGYNPPLQFLKEMDIWTKSTILSMTSMMSTASTQ